MSPTRMPQGNRRPFSMKDCWIMLAILVCTTVLGLAVVDILDWDLLDLNQTCYERNTQ